MGWHNDHQYWSACSAQNMISAWIPFEDMEIEMGPIMYLEGSHQWQAIEGMDFFSTDLNQLEEKISRAGHSLKKVPVVLKRGQVSFHHARTLHGSGSNRSAKSRRALAVHMQPVSNRPVPGKFHLAKVLNSELGPVDYAHPLLFPLLGSGSGNV
jgi:ectoine hydroxylase-related dioxygenase (phytanoyl-CoA dioxygenase family)